MEPRAFLAAERRLAGPLGQPRHQRDVRLYREVFLAAEGAAVADQFDVHFVARQPEHGGDLVAVVVDALPLRVHDELRPVRHGGERGGLLLPGQIPEPRRGRAIGQRNRQTRLRLEERVLDVLRLHLDVDCVRGVLPCVVEIATVDPGLAQLVRFRRMHQRRIRRQRLLGREHGFEHLVIHLDETGGLTRRALIVRGHHGEDVAHAMGLFALADEHRPIPVNQSDAFFAGHVSRRDDLHDPGQPFRRLRVDLQHLRARVL